MNHYASKLFMESHVRKILENINDKLFVQYPYAIPFINAYTYKEANQYIELISFDLLQFIMH